MQALEHADESAIVNTTFGCSQRLAGARFHQSVIKCYQGQVWMKLQALLTQRVQFLRDGCDRCLLALSAVRK